MRRLLSLFFLFLFLPICSAGFSAVPEFTLTSPSFKDSEVIPVENTCEGGNVSPALYWKNAPPATQSFILILENPDSPIGSWTHWILYNIPPMISNLPAELPKVDRLVNGEMHGLNDFQVLGYGGPCPSSGTHRYSFRLYALDYAPALEKALRKTDIRKVMEGHILGEAVLTGTYTPQPKQPKEK